MGKFNEVFKGQVLLLSLELNSSRVPGFIPLYVGLFLIGLYILSIPYLPETRVELMGNQTKQAFSPSPATVGLPGKPQGRKPVLVFAYS